MSDVNGSDDKQGKLPFPKPDYDLLIVDAFLEWDEILVIPKMFEATLEH